MTQTQTSGFLPCPGPPRAVKRPIITHRRRGGGFSKNPRKNAWRGAAGMEYRHAKLQRFGVEMRMVAIRFRVKLMPVVKAGETKLSTNISAEFPFLSARQTKDDCLNSIYVNHCYQIYKP